MKTIISFVAGLVVGLLVSTSVANAAQPTTVTPKVKLVLTKDNTITLNDAFDSDTVAKILLEIKSLDSRLPSGEPIYLVLNTPGGSIDAGVEMIERMANLNRKVHTVSLFSASMGFQTVQGLGKRYVTTDGTLMSHKARGGFSGEFPGQLDSLYSYYLKRVQRLDNKVVARTNGKHTAKSYAALIENEYWCDGQECVDQGFADAVVNATCDKSLDGTRKDTYKFFFFGMKIILDLISDACPLNTGIVDYEITIDGQKLFVRNEDNKTVKKDSWYYDEDTDVKLTAEQIEKLEAKIQGIINNRTQRTNIVKY